jgi:hypothetical protein
MPGMHGAGASLDYYGQERIAPSYAQQGGSRDKGQMQWRIKRNYREIQSIGEGTYKIVFKCVIGM